jgi:hypothetical protein
MCVKAPVAKVGRSNRLGRASSSRAASVPGAFSRVRRQARRACQYIAEGPVVTVLSVRILLSLRHLSLAIGSRSRFFHGKMGGGFAMEKYEKPESKW